MHFQSKANRLLSKGDEKAAEEALKQAGLWAKECAPYQHARLQAVAVQSETTVQYVARLPAPVKDIEECKLQVVSLLKH